MQRSFGLLRAAFVAVAFAAIASPAAPAEKPPCEQFARSLDRERTWFAGKIETLRSGAPVEALADGAFTIELVPASTISFVLPPENPPKGGMPNAAIVNFGDVTAPGRYQVTLSDEAWIDLIQAGAYRPSPEHSGVHGCPGLRKSVRFDLMKGQLTMQLSGASVSRIAIAFRHVN